MFKFTPHSSVKNDRPAIQMTSMIDVMFINLLFFMALFVYFQVENELGVKIPSASQSERKMRSSEIIINIFKNGNVVVNRKNYTPEAVESLLKRSVSLDPDQEVTIRADRDTRHEDVIRVLDICAKVKIWNISFAAQGIDT